MKRPFAVVRSAAARHDLELIFDHLFASYREFGDMPDEAYRRAANRIHAIEDAMGRLGRAPFQGTQREDLLPGLRQVTKDAAIFYFTVDEHDERVTVLAIFFGGQDHRLHMLKRLLGS